MGRLQGGRAPSAQGRLASSAAEAPGAARPSEQRCRALLREARTEAALDELRALVQVDEENAWAHAHLGDLLCRVRGDDATALRHLTRAVELDAQYVWAFAHRGSVLERLDRFDEAEADLRRALELNASNAWARAMLCRVYQFQARPLEALEQLELVIQQDRMVLPDWRAERGLLQTLAQRYEPAHAAYLEALAHDASDGLALYNAAINMQLWRGPAAAAPWIARARQHLEALPVTSRTLYELGGLLALEGHAEAAFARLRAAIEAEAGRVLLSGAHKRARIDLAWAGLRGHPELLALTRAACPAPSGGAA